MSGISSKAAGSLINKKGYNGNEIQNKEFGDGSGLEMYDFNARTYDQQIGRFIQKDPKSDEEEQESLSPYHFGNNNPVLYSDPDGQFPIVPILRQVYGLYRLAVATGLLRDGPARIFRPINPGRSVPDATMVVTTVPKLVIPAEAKASDKPTNEKSYETYQKPAKKEGDAPYAGQTSGKGTPEQNVAKRDKNHHMNDTHGPAELDKTSKDPNAIRGREQQLIVENGGAKSQGGTSGNQNNGIAPTNKKIDIYVEAAKKLFGEWKN